MKGEVADKVKWTRQESGRVRWGGPLSGPPLPKPLGNGARKKKKVMRQGKRKGLFGAHLTLEQARKHHKEATAPNTALVQN